MGVLVTIGDSLREAFFMFWETLWALVLGFGLSGAVQAFVSRGQMQRVMARRGPAALDPQLAARHGHLLVLVCRQGPGEVVVPEGRRLHRLHGVHVRLNQPGRRNSGSSCGPHRLAVHPGEFVGGAIMIVLLGACAGRARVLGHAPHEAGRRAASREREPACSPRQGVKVVEGPAIASRMVTWPGASDRSGWADAAGYTIADLTMLRREIVMGFVVAGLLAVAVPARVWNACSCTITVSSPRRERHRRPSRRHRQLRLLVGNVPLAAALWKDGISFGGVVASSSPT